MKELRFVLLAATFVFTLSLESSFAKIPRLDKDDVQSVVLGLVPQKQEQTQWCWAAIARMMMSSKIQNLPSQCEIVSTVKGKDCCKSPSSATCNQPYYEEKALVKLGYEVVVGHAKVDMSKKWNKRVDYIGWYNSVVKSIQNGTPVAIAKYNRAGTQDGSAHVVLAYATYKKGNNDYLVIYDPWNGGISYMDKTYVTGFMTWTSTVTLK